MILAYKISFKGTFLSSLLKYLTIITLLFFTWSCSNTNDASNENNQTKQNSIKAPEKITFLFVTQPTCPSCKRLEKTMQLTKPNELLTKYFEIKKIYLGKELPNGLIPPNGTPTVYFLGANNEVLVEPMVGEKTEKALMEFLEDALLEYKNTYKIDLTQKKEENNATQI